MLTGFLPPEDGTGRGKGYLSYLVAPKSSLATGTQITNVAGVIFDGQSVIMTNQVSETDPSQGTDPSKEALVTIDSGSPTSSVTALPSTESSSSFVVSWSGQDDSKGSGIGRYSIYVSSDNGSFQPWLTDTADTSATYQGVPGHTYAFYSLALDNVGNGQAARGELATTTVVGNVWHNYANPYDVNGDEGVTPLDVLILITYINGHPGDPALPTSPAVPPPYYDVSGGSTGEGDLQVTPLDVLAVINYINNPPQGSSAGEASQPAAGRPAGLVPISPASGGDLGQSTPVLIPTSPAAPKPLLGLDSSVLWLGLPDGPAVSPHAGSRGASEANNSRDMVSPPSGEEHEWPPFTQTAGLRGATLRGVVAASILIAADELMASLEDILPDVARDIERAWLQVHRRGA